METLACGGLLVLGAMGYLVFAKSNDLFSGTGNEIWLMLGAVIVGLLVICSAL